MQFNRTRLGEWLLCLCLLCSIEHIDAELCAVLKRANLVTISALTNAQQRLSIALTDSPTAFPSCNLD